MKKQLAVFIGIEDQENIITGGERQLQEMVAGLRRNGINTVFIPIEDVCNKLPQHVKDYQAKNICVISDYSKRFSLWRMTWKCKYQYGVRVCCSVGAFYFDYRASKIKNYVDYIVSYLYLKPADLICTTGHAVSQKLRKMGLGGKSIKDIYPAIRESLIDEAKKDVVAISLGKRIVLTVGRFHPVKGYDYLLDAIHYCKDIPDIHFVLVGDYDRKPDDYYKKIQKRIQDEGISHMITIYGKTKNDQELANLYRRAWCCLHTSVWESSPITVCEALLFGKPVIATNVGGTPEYLNDGEDSLLVPVKDGAAIWEAISKLYGDQTLYEHLCSNAELMAKKYVSRTWTDVGEEYFQKIMLR